MDFQAGVEVKTEISGILQAMGRDMDGQRSVWLQGQGEPFLLPEEHFELAWKKLGEFVRITVAPDGSIKSLVPGKLRKK